MYVPHLNIFASLQNTDMEVSITDLRPLSDFIVSNGLNLAVGSRTEADGSCFLHACVQSMKHLKDRNRWSSEIPEVEELRCMVIEFMRQNEALWTRPQYNRELNILQDPPYEEDTFRALVRDQSRPRAWTDRDGVFVLATMKMLDVQLEIILPHTPGPILESGLAGPYQIVNHGPEKTVFYMGLLQDDRENGHYQHLYKPAEVSQEFRMLAPVRNPSSPSPLKIRRGRMIAKYLKSPSPKKQKKAEHCLFCCGFFVGVQLEEHLNDSAKCLKYYLRNYKVKSPLPIIVKEFGCIFCPVSGQIRISNHLKKNQNCLQKYLEKFQVSSIKEVQTIVERLKRQLMPSSVNRKLELERMRKNYEDKNIQRTEIDLQNNFSRDTCFSNVIKCYKCGANYPMSSKRITQETDVESLDESLKGERRFQRYYSCEQCPNDDISRSYQILIQEDRSNILFYPGGSVAEGDDNGSFVQLNDKKGVNFTCLLPCSVQCLEFLDHRKTRSKQQNVGLIYRTRPNLHEIATAIFENEVFKYRGLKLFSERYQGVVDSEESRTLRNVEKIISDSSIVGSVSWRNNNFRDYSHRIQQLGTVCVHVSAVIPIESNDVLASIQVQDGFVVNVNFIGNSYNEQETEYEVHCHKSDSDCTADCSKVPLSQHLEDINFDRAQIKTNYLSTYLASVQLKFGSLIRNFIKASSSRLFSEKFHFQLFFSADNAVEIRGIVWPPFLEELNRQIGGGSNIFENDLKSKVCSEVDRLVVATCKQECLQQFLNVSQEEAQKLENSVMKNQYHFCAGDVKCENCERPQFPLLRTSILEWTTNYPACHEFKLWMLEDLKNHTEEQLMNTSTEKWLRSFITAKRILIDFIDNYNMEITFGDHTIQLRVDEKMLHLFETYLELYPDDDDSPLFAVYEYIVTTVSIQEVGGFLVKRPYLVDSYIKEFNVSLLKAFKSGVKVSVCNGVGKSRIFACDPVVPDWKLAVQLDEGISSTHQEVSLSEAMCLFDKKFIRSLSSNPVEFICAIQNRQKFFRKVQHPSEKSFQLENKHFEASLTSIERYFLRCSEEPGLCLAEFAQNYDFMGDKDSKDIYKLFTTKGVAIQNSKKKCISTDSDELFLPEFILLKNGDVMKLRENMKVLIFPWIDEGSQEFMYQKVLLFSPRARETMTDHEVVLLFQEKDKELCQDLTLIQRIEK